MQADKAPSTQNRNFKGRMGDNSAEIHLSSVETAAVSTIKVLTIRDKRGSRRLN